MIEEYQLDFIRKNLMKYLMEDYLPFPVNKSVCYEWANGLNIKRGGETIIYTGCSYQLAVLGKRFDDVLPSLSKFKGIDRFSSILKVFYKPRDERANRILRNIASILSKKVDFGYLYEDEPYSGTILLELGMLEEFKEYGKKLIDFFNQRKVKKIITVDPHTHYTLLRIKEMLPWDVEVVNYYELLKDIKVRGEGTFVFHDSCLYSRFLGMRDLIRDVVKSSGIVLKEDEMVTGKETSMCCGGPLAPINNEVSEKIAKSRAEALKSVHTKVLLACPFCYANLSSYVEAYDFAEVISVE
ncbi:(Fe-S)-binding protein [Saccharolobus shibatae]|uniref:Heterodisulfide reductase related protein n=1 Tax=Saccharolobus shibatae TaxID=2286 RepID=A0A8F5BYP8_9CREN|nr:(Fe-S)-binding protein [Saccharolobus shibatae]QXJ33819.1 Heterodisulfide reductase related protein [Saccharolobus shibatae]